MIRVLALALCGLLSAPFTPILPAAPAVASTQNADSSAVASAIHPGMTRQQVADIMGRPRYSGDGEPRFERFDFSDDAHLVVEYQYQDPNVFRNPLDRVVKATTFSLADFQRQIPPAFLSTMELIRRCPSLLDTMEFDPAALIAAVNHLHAMGKGGALSALSEYTRIADDLRLHQDRAFGLCYPTSSLSILPLTRILFVSDRWPALYVGERNYKVDTHDPAWAIFPFVVQDQIPFMMIQIPGIAGSGPPKPQAELDYCRDHCSIRDGPLVPTASPLVAAQRLLDSSGGQQFIRDNAHDPEFASRLQYQLRREAVMAAGKLLSPPLELRGRDLGTLDDNPLNDKTWTAYLADPATSLIHWDPSENAFRVGR
jgi:hypothetical protein